MIPRLFLALTLLSAAAAGHEFTITSVALVFSGAGAYQANISLDVDALALGLPLETDSGTVAEGMSQLSAAEFERAVAQAQAAIRRDIRLQFDGEDSEFEVAFPHYGTAAAAQADPPTVLGTIARLSGAVPASAANVSFQAAPRFKTVDLRIYAAGETEPAQVLLRPAERSTPYSLRDSPEGGERSTLSRGVFWRYALLGYEHILPKGIDHILFVLGLFLLSARTRPLFYQVTAFTVAHSLTLALSMLDVVSLPSRPVETLIAVSIAYVAVENIVTSELKPWRIAVVFAFGLLHGLGFAGVLRELGLPQGRFLPALVAFNLGVELGQLSVVALAFLVLGRFRSAPGYRKWVVVPCSLAIAVVGVWWAFERALE